jgi:hypothetical protein
MVFWLQKCDIFSLKKLKFNGRTGCVFSKLKNVMPPGTRGGTNLQKKTTELLLNLKKSYSKKTNGWGLRIEIF